MKNPKAGASMENTGGIRKIRVAFNGKGKSGGSRVCIKSICKLQEYFRWKYLFNN